MSDGLYEPPCCGGRPSSAFSNMRAGLLDGTASLGVCAVVSIGSLDMVVVPVMGWLVLGVVKVIVKPSRCFVQ